MHATHPAGGEIDLEFVVEVTGRYPELAGLVDRVDTLLAEIEREAQQAGPGREEVVVSAHRQRAYDALVAIGEWLAAFQFDESDREAVARARAEIDGHFLRWSNTSPIYARMRDLANGRKGYSQLMQHLRAARPAGASMPALVLNDFYLHSRMAEAARTRVNMVGRALRAEVARPTASGRVNVLCLQYAGGGEVGPLLEDETLARAVQLTYVDDSTEGLRHARQGITDSSGLRLRVERGEPLTYVEDPARPRAAYHVIYSVSYLEGLSDWLAVRLLRACAGLLRAGGVFLAAGLTTQIPLGERILHTGLLEWQTHYRDAGEWSRIFAQTPFTAERLQLTEGANGMVLVARAEAP